MFSGRRWAELGLSAHVCCGTAGVRESLEQGGAERDARGSHRNKLNPKRKRMSWGRRSCEKKPKGNSCIVRRGCGR